MKNTILIGSGIIVGVLIYSIAMKNNPSVGTVTSYATTTEDIYTPLADLCEQKGGKMKSVNQKELVAAYLMFGDSQDISLTPSVPPPTCVKKGIEYPWDGNDFSNSTTVNL